MKNKRILKKFLFLLTASALIIPTSLSYTVNNKSTSLSSNKIISENETEQLEFDATLLGADPDSGIASLYWEENINNCVLDGVQSSTFKATKVLNFGNGKIEDDGITYTITEIGEDLFEGSKIDGQIILPNTINAIRKDAFLNSIHPVAENAYVLTVPSSVSIIDINAFKGCLFSDIYFENNDIASIEKMSFSSNSEDPSLSWAPELVEGGCVWFPYDSQTEEVVEDGITYKVTKVMKAFHDKVGFNFKYSSIRNGKPMSTPKLSETKLNMDVWQSQQVVATIADDVDVNLPENVITWKVNKPNMLISLDGTQNWSKEITTKNTKEHVIFVTSTTPIENGQISIECADHHNNKFTSNIEVTSNYEQVIDFRFNEIPEEISIKPNETYLGKCSIYEISKNNRFVPGINFLINNFKKDGKQIDIPEWISLETDVIDAPEIGNLNLFTNFINIGDKCEKGSYTFDLTASSMICYNKTQTKTIKLNITDSPTPPTPPTPPSPTPAKEKSLWWVWLLVGLGSLALVGGITFFVIHKQKNKNNN